MNQVTHWLCLGSSGVHNGREGLHLTALWPGRELGLGGTLGEGGGGTRGLTTEWGESEGRTSMGGKTASLLV